MKFKRFQRSFAVRGLLFLFLLINYEVYSVQSKFLLESIEKNMLNMNRRKKTSYTETSKNEEMLRVMQIEKEIDEHKTEASKFETDYGGEIQFYLSLESDILRTLVEKDQSLKADFLEIFNEAFPSDIKLTDRQKNLGMKKKPQP